MLADADSLLAQSEGSGHLRHALLLPEAQLENAAVDVAEPQPDLVQGGVQQVPLLLLLQGQRRPRLRNRRLPPRCHDQAQVVRPVTGSAPIRVHGLPLHHAREPRPQRERLVRAGTGWRALHERQPDLLLDILDVGRRHAANLDHSPQERRVHLKHFRGVVDQHAVHHGCVPPA
ncbi:MAG TPA: hypothetical protein VEL76_20075 [Gemmataceae bacterium]|nr:hypothetical protein [Gemmataceae bacterium]